MLKYVTIILSLIFLSISNLSYGQISEAERNLFTRQAVKYTKMFCDYVEYLSESNASSPTDSERCKASPLCSSIYDELKSYFAEEKRGSDAKAVAFTQRDVNNGKVLEYWESIDDYSNRVMEQKQRHKVVVYKFSSLNFDSLIETEQRNGKTIYKCKVCFTQHYYYETKKSGSIEHFGGDKPELGKMEKHIDEKCANYEMKKINVDGNRFWAVYLMDISINHEKY